MKKIFLMMAAVLWGVQTHALEPLEFKTPAGLTVWLVESDALPMVSLQVSFRAGAAFDPPERAGLAAYTAALMTEGAGTLRAQPFKEALADLGAQLGASADSLNLTVSLTTLDNKLPEALALLGTAVRQPRFDSEAGTRIKEAMLASIKRQEESPDNVSAQLFKRSLFPEHAYGQAVGGTTKSVAGLGEVNAKWFHGRHINKSNMVVSVVGNISAEKLGPLLDEALGALPTGTGYRNQVLAEPKPAFASLIRQEMQTPQTHIFMGQKFIDREHPLYYAAYVMNYMLGGGSFNSRLMEEVREKNGLAYSIYSTFEPLPKGGAFYVALQTADADKALPLIRQEIGKLAAKPVSAEEFNNAVRFLVDSFPLRLDSNAKILNYLTVMQLENLGADYLTKWPEHIAATTPEQVQKAAQLLHVDAMTTVLVGKLEAGRE